MADLLRGNDKPNVPLECHYPELSRGQSIIERFAHPIESDVALLAIAMEALGGTVHRDLLDEWINTTFPYYDARLKERGKKFSSTCKKAFKAYPHLMEWLQISDGETFQFRTDKYSCIAIMYNQDAPCFTVDPTSPSPNGTIPINVKECFDLIQIVKMIPGEQLKEFFFTKSTGVIKPYNATAPSIACVLGSEAPKSVEEIVDTLSSKFFFYRFYSNLEQSEQSLYNHVLDQIKENRGFFDTRLGGDGKDRYFLKVPTAYITEEGQLVTCIGSSADPTIVRAMKGWTGTLSPSPEKRFEGASGAQEMVEDETMLQDEGGVPCMKDNRTTKRLSELQRLAMMEPELLRVQFTSVTLNEYRAGMGGELRQFAEPIEGIAVLVALALEGNGGCMARKDLEDWICSRYPFYEELRASACKQRKSFSGGDDPTVSDAIEAELRSNSFAMDWVQIKPDLFRFSDKVKYLLVVKRPDSIVMDVRLPEFGCGRGTFTVENHIRLSSQLLKGSLVMILRTNQDYPDKVCTPTRDCTVVRPYPSSAVAIAKLLTTWGPMTTEDIVEQLVVRYFYYRFFDHVSAHGGLHEHIFNTLSSQESKSTFVQSGNCWRLAGGPLYINECGKLCNCVDGDDDFKIVSTIKTS